LNVQRDYTKVETRKVNAAILFCDIRGFTQMSETLRIEEVVTVLNDYFSFGAQAVTSNGGQVNKFIGDAILAIFQDPPEYSSGMQACRNAAAAAMALQAAFGYQKQKWRDKISTPFEAGLGVGVHFGEVILGNLGSPERMEYTAIGDTVNFASRLCGLALAGQVRLSEQCHGIVSDRYTADETEPVSVKGKSGQYKTYLVTGKKPGNF
jgi:adenylate cyclase